MRLLGLLTLTKDLVDAIPPYALLSHTWGDDDDEVLFREIQEGEGHRKIKFCADQAASDGLQHFWVDSCCIDKSSSTELQESITSMFRWYQNAAKCYVYLSDVTSGHEQPYKVSPRPGESAFRRSRWFTRG
ncbi:heterokaryon incompatibility protein-domain-containing protein [Xylariaceae sp. FL1651]|nr:heterokaryon incompatibility protein-domain-containing protein [Xylariaceae sp. FL1651]